METFDVKNTMKRLFSLLSVVAFLVQSGQVKAATIDLPATERGSYRSGTFGTGGSGTSIGNYLTGSFTGSEYRSFFNFDLSSVSATITSASFEFSLDEGGYSPDTFETLGIFDYTGSIPALVSGVGGLMAHVDLGSGALYGSALVDTSLTSGTVTIPLSATAIANMNTAIGGDFAFGGALTSLGGTITEYLFGSSLGSQITVLHLEVVPEPTTATLALAALCLVVGRRR